jgi:hypothetical protein
MDLMDFLMTLPTPFIYCIGLDFTYTSIPATFNAGYQNKEIEDQTIKMDIIM